MSFVELGPMLQGLGQGARTRHTTRASRSPCKSHSILTGGRPAIVSRSSVLLAGCVGSRSSTSRT